MARVLVIAGSDSGGGAGIQADIKTITALGGYAATAITALTAQNTLGVHGVLPVPPDFVARQMRGGAGRHRRRRDQDRHAGQPRRDRGGGRGAASAGVPPSGRSGDGRQSGALRYWSRTRWTRCCTPSAAARRAGHAQRRRKRRR